MPAYVEDVSEMHSVFFCGCACWLHVSICISVCHMHWIPMVRVCACHVQHCSAGWVRVPCIQ